LYSHLNTSGLARFTELAADQGKFNSLVTEIEQYSLGLLSFLKILADEVAEKGVKTYFQDEVKPGLTKSFLLLAWNDALQKAGGNAWIKDSWYELPVSIPGTGLYRLKCGAYFIGIASSKKTLQTYENWHKYLRDKFVADPLVKEIITRERKITDIVQDIRERLREFSDMETLPGRCDFCS
jgi:hypothetical protein